MRVLQWNCRSVKAKLAELQKHIVNFDIILLLETWLSQDDHFVLNNFDTIRKDRLDR